MPDIVGIDTWGGTRNGWGPMPTLPAQAVWVHHSVTNPTSDAFADFQVLDRIGLSQGHGGISYSWVIHPDGTIGEGQATNRGAHTGGQGGCNGSPWGWNACSFGICFVGNYMELSPTAESISSFQWLRDYLLNIGVLDAGIYPTGGHRDAPGNSTACPGNNLEAIIDVLRLPYDKPSPVQEYEDMFIAVGKTVFGVSIAFLVTGGRVLRTFNGPEGAYGIPQDALDWRAQPGRDAVTYIFVDVEIVNQFLAPWPNSQPTPAPGDLTAQQKAAIESGIKSGQALDSAF